MAFEDSVFERRAAPVETALAAAKLGKGTNLESVWRAMTDGSLQIARPHWGRVELYTIRPGAPPELTACSERSSLKALSDALGWLTAASIAIGVLGAFLVGPQLVSVGAISFVAFPLALILHGRSHVRPWLRRELGSDEDWTKVPWQLEGEPATANQFVAMSGVIDRDGNAGQYRTLADGTVELRTKAKKLYTISRMGLVTEVAAAELPPWLPSYELKKQDEWSQVLTYDPTD